MHTLDWALIHTAGLIAATPLAAAILLRLVRWRSNP